VFSPTSKQKRFVRVGVVSFGALPCREMERGGGGGGGGKLDSSRLDVVEIARFPEMLPSLFPSWSG